MIDEHLSIFLYMVTETIIIKFIISCLHSASDSLSALKLFKVHIVNYNYQKIYIT